MPLENLLRNQFDFIEQTHQPLSEITRLPYWKFEKFIQYLNEKNEERRKEHEKANKAQQSQQSNLSPGSFMNKFKMPKL